MDAGLHQVEEHKLGRIMLTGFDFDLLGRGVDHIGIRGVSLLDEVCARLQPGQDNLPGLVGGVCSDERGIPVNLKCGIGEGPISLLVVLENAEGGLGFVLDDNSGIIAGGGIVEVDIDAVHLAVQSVALRSLSLPNFIVPGSNAANIGKAIVVGSHGIDEGTVLVDLEGGKGQIEMGTGILLANDKGGLPGVLEGQGHICPAVPMDCLNGAVQFIALGCCNLKHFVAADGKLVCIELDVSGGICDPGSGKGAINLFKADHGATEGIAGLPVNFMDSQGVLGIILYRVVESLASVYSESDRVHGGVTGRGCGFSQGVCDIGRKVIPANDAVFICCSSTGTAVRSGQRKYCSLQGDIPAANFADLQLSPLCDWATPGEDGISFHGALGGVSDDIGLLVVCLVLRQINLILHNLSGAVDGNLSAGSSRIYRDTEFGFAAELKAVIVEIRILEDNGEPPGVRIMPFASHQLHIIEVSEDGSGRAVGGPQVNGVVLIVGGGGAGKGVHLGVVGLAVDDLSLDPVTASTGGELQIHIRINGKISVQLVVRDSDVHPGLIDSIPVLSNTQDALDGAKHTHLLGIPGGLTDSLSAIGERRSLNSKLAQGGPNSNLGGIAVLILGQPRQDWVVAEVKTEEGFQRVLGIAVGKGPGCLRRYGIFPRDGQDFTCVVKTMVNAIGRTGQPIVGGIGVARAAQIGPLVSYKEGMSCLWADCTRLASVLDGGSGGGDAHAEDRANSQQHGHQPILHRMIHFSSPFEHKK